MKNTKIELLKKKLSMLALATSLSVTSLAGCDSTNVLSTEKIEKNIKKAQDFGNYAGLYKSQDGTWKIYFEKRDKHYDFKSYEYLDNAICNSGICVDNEKRFGFDVGYLPLIMCNPNVTYTLNVVNHLDEADIEKLKKDFFQKNGFWANDIKLFYIEDIDGTNQKMVIGYPVSKIDIFNMETWQFENYEGNAIVEESCEFNNDYVYLSEILDYLNEKKKNIVEISTNETETIMRQRRH